MAPLTLFNEGVPEHFPICGKFYAVFADGNLCMGLLVAGGFIWFPLHMTMVWYLARGAGIPAPSDAIDVCFSIHQSALIGGDGDSRSTEGRRPKAAEQMSESRRFLRKQEKRRAPSDKRSVCSR